MHRRNCCLPFAARRPLIGGHSRCACRIWPGRACKVRLLRLAGGTGGHAAPTTALHRAMHDAPVTLAGRLAHAGLPMPPMNAQTVAIFHIEAG
jgi:hypothetical protein